MKSLVHSEEQNTSGILFPEDIAKHYDMVENQAVPNGLESLVLVNFLKKTLDVFDALQIIHELSMTSAFTIKIAPLTEFQMVLFGQW